MRYLFLFLVGLVMATGCATQLDPNADPFVVEAEKDIRTAFYVVDGFLEWELANRGTAPSEVTDAADTLRRQFPPAYKSAQDTLRTYKNNRDSSGRATVATWLSTINQATLEALRYLPRTQAQQALKKAGTPI